MRRVIANGADVIPQQPNDLSQPSVNEGVVGRIAAVARQGAEQIAVSSSGANHDYADLARTAGAAAGALRAAGVKPGDLVAVCLPRSFERIAMTYAVLAMGAAYLPLDPAWPDAMLQGIVADAGCVALIGDDKAAARNLVPAGVPVVRPGAGDAAPAGDALDPQALAYVVYSSGSTGKPKGSEISHANLASLVDWHNAAFEIGPDDRVAHLAGLGFDAAVWEVWPPLCVGAALVLAPEDVRVSPEALRDWLVAERITVAFVPTVLAERLIALAWPAGCALRTLLTGGDRLHAFPPAGLPFTLVNNYGPSECTVVATSGVVAPGGEGLPSIGWPIAGTTIELRDADGQPVADGTPGEIVIGGAGVGQGYRGRFDLSAERFIVENGERHFRTGDLGVRGPDGAIAFVGRVDDQVQVRGHRVEPAEVAAVLARHAGVASAAVIAVTEGGQVSLAAYLVLRAGQRPGAVEMRDFAGAHLPPAMIPARYLVVDALPLTANGKLDRAALPHPDHAERLAEAALVLPETPVEAKLAELLSVIMHGRAIGIDDNFFMIGGHSLLGAQLVLRAGEAFGVELALRDLFAAPTIRQLAQAVEAKVIAMVAAMSDAETLARIDG